MWDSFHLLLFHRHDILSCPFCEGLSMTLAQGSGPNSLKVLLRGVCQVTIGSPWNYPCFRSSYSLAIICIGLGSKRIIHFFCVFLVVCFLVSSSRTSYTCRTRYIHSVNRDVLCQMPPEAGHPPEIAAWSKKPACGVSDAPSTMVERVEQITLQLWCGSDTSWPMWLCVVLKRVSQNGTERALHEGMAQMTSQLNRVCDHREMQNLSECWIPLKEARQIRGRNLKPFLTWSLRKSWNRNGTTCPSQTYKKTVFKLVQKNGMTCSVTGQRIRWMRDLQSGPSIEVSQE